MSANSFTIIVRPAERAGAEVDVPGPRVMVTVHDGVLRVGLTDPRLFKFAHGDEGFLVRLMREDWIAMRHEIDRLIGD